VFFCFSAEGNEKGEIAMKNYFAAALFLAASIAAAPAVPVYIAGPGKQVVSAEEKVPSQESAEPLTDENTEEVTEETSVIVDEAAETQYTGTPYRVLDIASGEVLEVSERDYVIGAVCAEMPASFGEEALKAQAVAAHTYAERQRKKERSAPHEELGGADFSNDTSKYQGFFTKEQTEKFYGENFEANYGKISAAVDEVLPYILTYEDEPIISAFHSMSSGKTESAENAWGASVDYLVPVDSSCDTSAPKYLEQQHFGRESLEFMLKSAFPDIELGEDMSEWVKVIEVSDSGTVLTAQAGDMTVTGNDIRTALVLRSACFDVTYEDDEAIFTTRGYGHGVGMSQYGANSMAAEGKNWKEILEHYYSGCNISKQ